MPFLPFNPIDIPVYLVPGTTNCFLYDDSEVDYSLLSELSLQMSSNVPSPPDDGGGDGGGGDGGGGDPYIGPLYGSNDLWIEIVSTTNNQALLDLHGTQSPHYYQLMAKTNLNELEWELGEIVQATSGTNQIFFTRVAMSGRDMMYFQAAKSDTVLSAVVANNAEEPSPNSDGTVGDFVIAPNQPTTANVQVVYRMGGAAISGVDYTNLPGIVTLSASDAFADVWIQAIQDNEVEFDEPLTLTIVRTNGYLVDPDFASATMYIQDPPTNYFTVVATGFSSPAGIDYHPTTNALILSVSAFSGQAYNFVRIFTNGIATNSFVTNWSGITSLPDKKNSQL